jgi:hypothetical protein
MMALGFLQFLPTIATVAQRPENRVVSNFVQMGFLHLKMEKHLCPTLLCAGEATAPLIVQPAHLFATKRP